MLANRLAWDKRNSSLFETLSDGCFVLDLWTGLCAGSLGSSHLSWISPVPAGITRVLIRFGRCDQTSGRSRPQTNCSGLSARGQMWNQYLQETTPLSQEFCFYNFLNFKPFWTLTTTKNNNELKLKRVLTERRFASFYGRPCCGGTCPSQDLNRSQKAWRFLE